MTAEKKLDTFTACSILEGFCGGENATEAERLEALQSLIDSGAVWRLQGCYGRAARDAILAGLCEDTHKVLGGRE